MLHAADLSHDSRALGHWLRLLWARPPALHLDSERVYLADGAVHLPPRGAWREHRAAAAHAAAHVAFSPRQFEGEGLGVLVRALVGVLEDARVEALAGRELPGLLRLWQQQHAITPAAGEGLPALLRRLARALADPAYADPHPWVTKGRRLCFLDAAQSVPALRTASEVVQAARRLGHDIGQQRLAFDAQVAQPLLPYRDDHRWMWPAERPPEPLRSTPQRQPGASAEDADPLASAPAPADVLAMLPEWDRLIGRLRPRWCSLREVPAAATETPAGAAEPPVPLPCRLRPNPLSARPAARSRSGVEWDLDALLQACVGRRHGLPFDAAVYRDRRPGHAVRRVWLVVDQSASTARNVAPGDDTVLERSADMALSLLLALQRHGVRCALSTFRSRGRHAVEWTTLKRFGEPVDPRLATRLRALRAEGSTRIGAAVRHAAATWAGAARGRRCVVLFSDGEPHDIDIHDPRYLVEDARQAVLAAQARSIRVLCLSPLNDLADAARRIFGRAHGAAVPTRQALSAVLRRMGV